MLIKKQTMAMGLPQTFLVVIGLSWFYALCSQIILWLPCIPVPISLQPIPLYMATLIVGWPAVSAYVLYLLQGACGLPFFAGMQGGLMRLLGPTGGYLFGWLCAMTLLALMRERIRSSWLASLVSVSFINVIVFVCGLWRLSSFVSGADLFAVGLLPFFIGDFIMKPFVLMGLIATLSQKSSIKKQL